MRKILNLYCDESTHLKNDHQPYLLLGFICVSARSLNKYRIEINAIKGKHNFFSEIKWVNVSNSKKNFYLDILDHFFESEISFSALVIDKNNIKNLDLFTFEAYYYEKYLQLLNDNTNSQCVYNIYLDIKDTLSSWKLQKIKDILHNEDRSINNLQNIRSHESLFLQLADLLIGAINYDLRNKSVVYAKNKIIEKLKNRLDCDNWSLLSNRKFNVKFVDQNAV